MRQWAWLLALATPCAAAAQATPAEPPSPPNAPAAADESTIVVTGKTEPPPAEVVEQAEQLSRVSPYQLYDEALPRFEMPLCPGVFGLREDYAGEITARIRANAERLGARVAGPRCEPNLYIAFVDDGHELVSRLAAAHPKVFCIIDADAQAEILREGEPVRVWSHIRIIDIRWTGGPTRIHRCRQQVPSQTRKPDMFLAERRDIVSSLIVFDREQVLGMSTTQLADYATMRGLAHTRPASGDEPMETILALFEGDRSRPLELTSFDRGYLESLYRGRPDQRAMTRFLGVGRRAEEAREESARR
jgi:hypothetical protein